MAYSVNLGGKEIPLRYTMAELADMEETLGTVETTEEQFFKGRKRSRNLAAAIRIMGNAGLKAAGKEPDLTDENVLERMKPGQLRQYQIAVMGTITDAFRMETEEESTRDLTLEEIEKKKYGCRLTYRRIVSYGLIAGLAYPEMQQLTPGLVLDAYILRRNYDDVMHGIRRGDE